MSAICGIFDMNRKTINSLDIENLENPYEEYSFERQTHIRDEGIYLSAKIQLIMPESVYEKGIIKDEAIYFICDAIVDNRESLMLDLEINNVESDEISDGEILYLAYKKWGRNCPKFVFGDYVFAVYDIQSKTYSL